ncbi:alpha/beta fold hydrolase [Halorarius halobius]|uniref:alpha/beta fold hydrolase n=1 Tax=Halorarius halobius TaxID=2962671 RepID=UPI0020CEE401|nr:alpha/beta hydrolase [Halorarius halobius]
MPRATVQDGVDLFYEDLGAGPPVLLVHGGFMSHRVWERQVTTLVDAGYRVVTPDLRGHGRSDKPASDYTAAMHAADLEGVRERLGIDAWAVVGWSLGATVAAEYADATPERLTHLALVSTGIFEGLAPDDEDDDGEGLNVEALVEGQRSDRPAGMAAYVDRMFGGEPEPWTKRWLWSIGMETPQRVAVKTLDIYRDPDYDRLAAALSALDVPCAAFHGKRDGAATPEAAAYVAREVFTDGRFVAFEASGHLPFLAEPERFDDHLLALLDA